MTVRSFVIGELDVSPYNVRTDRRAIDALDAMKKSILEHGVLMPLVVHPMIGSKKFGAIAGGRRYRALKALIGEGKLPADYAIEAVVREGYTEAQLIAISTAENLVRRDLYPYETYAALARATRRGLSAESLAKTLGQDIAWVRRGARLGALAHPVFEAYAAEEITLECAKAFGATEDTKLQLQAFEAFRQLPAHDRTAAAARRLLKVGDAELTRLLLFVGESRYIDEGGTYEPDLFADAGEFRGLVRDEGLLRELVAAALEQLRAGIRARAGRDLRFAAEPPRNQHRQIDYSLQIEPPIGDLGDTEEALLHTLKLERDAIVDRSRPHRDPGTGQTLPGHEDAIAALDLEFDPLDAEIEAMEAKRPIVLPAGDVIATIEIDDTGTVEPRFWWESRAAQAAATAPAPKPAPAPAAKPKPAAARQDLDRPIADGAAIPRPATWNPDPRARDRADRAAKISHGLTAEGVQTARTLRRAIMRELLIQDSADGGNVAHDYLIWAQLRMLLTQADSNAVGMTGFVPADRDDGVGAELVEVTTAGQFAESLDRVRDWLCFKLPELETAFMNYRALDEGMKADAVALLACLVLERSLGAPGYRIRMHDVVAQETGMAGAAEIREIGAFSPSPSFFNLFSKEHRLELAIPFVGRETVASWARKGTAEQNKLVSRIFTGGFTDLLEGVEDSAARWMHPLLAFDDRPAR